MIILLRRNKIIDKNNPNLCLRWDYKGWVKNNLLFYSQKEWNQSLVTKINQSSAQIHKASLTGGANKLIVPKHLMHILEDMEYYKETTLINPHTFEPVTKKTLSGRYMIIETNKDIDEIRVGSDSSPIEGIIMVDGIGITNIPTYQSTKKRPNLSLVLNNGK